MHHASVKEVSHSDGGRRDEWSKGGRRSSVGLEMHPVHAPTGVEMLGVDHVIFTAVVQRRVMVAH